MAEWELAQTDPNDELAQLHFFSVKKKQAERDIEFRITIREFANRRDNRAMQFFAEADKQTNQSIAPYTPTGWGPSLAKALSECVRAINRFPYEGPMPDANMPGG